MTARNVAFGSKAAATDLNRGVRFHPQSGLDSCRPARQRPLVRITVNRGKAAASPLTGSYHHIGLTPKHYRVKSAFNRNAASPALVSIVEVLSSTGTSNARCGQEGQVYGDGNAAPESTKNAVHLWRFLQSRYHKVVGFLRRYDEHFVGA